MREPAALYARVSTQQQEEEATIDSQVAAIEAYAQQEGHELKPEYYFLDQAVSGAKLARPALERLRDLAAEGGFGTVLCLSPDRLARQYAHQWVLMDELQRAGVQVVFVNQPNVADGPQGQLMLGIQGLFAEYERAMITERLRRGKLYRIRQGQLVNPNPPYGYRYIPISEPGGGRWEPHEVEAEVVRNIYQWYTAERLKLGEIVERLRAQGPIAPSRGKRWTYSTVQAILKQTAYTGKAYYNRTRACHEVVGRPKKHGRGYLRTPTHVERPREEWIEVSVPAVLDAAIWERAQERLAMNKKFASRNNKRHFYLLKSILVCATCGRTLSGRVSKGSTYYYCTNRGKNRYADVPQHSCSISGKIIEPIVWEAVSNLLRNPTLIADAWQNEIETENAAPDETDRLRSRQRTLERQWMRVLDAFQDGLLDKPELERRKNRLDEERRALDERLQQLAQHDRRMLAKEHMVQDFASFCQKINSALDDPSPELQQEVIRLLIDHVVVGNDEIVIKHIVPTDDDCRLLPGRRSTRMNTDFLIFFDPCLS